MNIGDKIIAVGTGRKTKELNGHDLVRPSDRLPGFAGLVSDIKVMTVKELDGDKVMTPFYTFHCDDVHLVDIGRASAPLRAVPAVPIVELDGGEYTAEELRRELDNLTA